MIKHMMRAWPLMLLLLHVCLPAQARPCTCKDVCDHPDRPAQYKIGSEDLMRFVMKDLSPVIGGFMEREHYKHIPDRFTILFTVSADGHVCNASFSKLDVSTECQMAMRNVIMRMPGWRPAQQGGKPVCSAVIFPIYCLKWDIADTTR